MSKNSVRPAKNLVVFAGAYPEKISQDLTQVVDQLGYKILPASIGAFKSGEANCELYKGQKDLFVQNKHEITGSTVHIVADIGTDINKFFVDTVNVVATVKEYGAKNVHVVLPFAPFARQDRRFANKMVSVMGKTFPKMLKAAGAKSVTAFDMHSKASESYYVKAFGERNVAFLSAAGLMAEEVLALTKGAGHLQVGAPDGYDKPDDIARAKAENFETIINKNKGWTDYPNSFGIVKRHVSTNETEATLAAGRVKGKTAVIVDDMVDTGGTLKNAARILKAEQASKTITAVTHPILSGDSLEVLTFETVDNEANPIDRLVLTDSIMSIYGKIEALPAEQKERVRVTSIVPLIKQAIAPKVA